MKRTIISSLFLFALVNAKAQNGGQLPENNSVRIQYDGYQSNYFKISLINKVDTCINDFKVTWDSPINNHHDTTIHNVIGNSTVHVDLPGTFVGNMKISAKPLNHCNTDMGLVEITTPISLPIKFKSFRARRVN